MKDSRVGTWAVIGLVFLLLGKWIAIRAVEPGLLILSPVLGRWSMVLTAYGFPYARSSGLGAYFREGLKRQQVILASVFAAATVLGYSVLAGNLRSLLVLPLALLIAAGMGYWAMKRLGGGLTGDVYGAICELTELIVLLVFVGLR